MAVKTSENRFLLSFQLQRIKKRVINLMRIAKKFNTVDLITQENSKFVERFYFTIKPYLQLLRM